MVAYLVGPGPGEVILLLDFDFLMSSFGEGLIALCTKRCLAHSTTGKVKTRIPLSHPVTSLAATCVQHRHNREMPHKTWRDRMRRVGRLRRPIAEISHLVGT